MDSFAEEIVNEMIKTISHYSVTIQKADFKGKDFLFSLIIYYDFALEAMV
jgi:hypothetical protein